MSAIDLHIANQLRLANSDLEAVKLLAAIDNRNGAYHAQQTAEKILLALLTAEGVHIERKDSHRLDVMRDKLPDQNTFKRRFDDLIYLTIYATTYRYPKNAGRIPAAPDKAMLSVAIANLETVLKDIAQHFDVDLSAPDSVPAKNNHPPR